MTTGNLLLDRQLARWYPLKPHPVQLALLGAVPSGIRFPLVPAGRRSGKTERFKRFLVKQANEVPGAYFAAAPTHDQAKKIFWDDLKAFTLSALHPRRPSESDRIIYLPNGSEIHVIGLDKPQRIEGIPWKGGGIDEFADIKPDAWEANILPALNTVNPTDPDYRAWCWLLGVPDGLNHYYDLCEQAKSGGDPNFAVFHWKSSEILPDDVIAAMRRAMSAKQFKQEFEASFETASGRIYEDYGDANRTAAEIEPHEQLLWFHDFNYTPLSSGVGVMRGKSLYVLDEVVLTSAVAKQSALEFVERYATHENKRVLLYGDPAGKAGEKHSQRSNYTDIETVLMDAGWHVERRVRAAAPAIKDRQNAVRAKIRNANGDVSLYVNAEKAPYMHKGLSTVQLKKGSAYQEEESDYQHITTAIGYMVDFEFPVIPKERKAKPEHRRMRDYDINHDDPDSWKTV
ncbi:TPA: terminase large subunit domain-containing protein [Stenotrophomonas maltophilia]